MRRNTKPRREIRASASEARRNPKRRASLFVENSQHAVSAQFGAALRQRRIALGMTQAALAKRAGIDRSFISTLECGRTSISLERAERLAAAVDSTLLRLLAEAGRK
jgi:ribosome-binding protein aMBF1 (putative translation factor)